MNHRSRPTNPNRLAASMFFLVIAALAATVVLRPRANAAQESSRSVLYLHGRMYTNDPQHPWAAAMAVRDGKIICVGSIAQVMSECGVSEAHPETVQLHEQFVMPGFNDAHMHLGYAGQGMLAVRLYGAVSIEEVKKRLAAGVAARKPGEWI